MPKRKISIIGSTGSIGRQALEVLEYLQDKFEITALAGGLNTDLLLEQAEKFRQQIQGAAKHHRSVGSGGTKRARGGQRGGHVRHGAGRGTGPSRIAGRRHGGGIGGAFVVQLRHEKGDVPQFLLQQARRGQPVLVGKAGEDGAAPGPAGCSAFP